MKATKKVEFNKEEIENATKNALISIAATTIGAPAEDEEYTVELCSWRHDATVEIVKKPTVGKPEDEPNAQVAEPIRSILNNFAACPEDKADEAAHV